MDTMRLLQDRGWDGFIRRWIDDDRPFFGICLGLQALFDFSEEGDTPGLGVFRGKVQRFRFPGCPQIKIPHMGWNAARFRSEADALLQGIVLHGEPFYFVHSFHVVADDPDLVWATTEYGGLDFCSAIRRGNLVATQFHPEKSQSAGLQLYRNFVAALPG
jgi:glutamine amidotransferase